MPDNALDELLEEIDEQIQKIDNSKVMKAAQRLLDKKQKLMNARRALLGAGPRTTGGSGGSRVTQDEVIAWFKKHEPGASFEVSDIADDMGHSHEVIRGHLNRGKGERFIKGDNSRWGLRDPKNGIDDSDDLVTPDEDDE